MYCVSEMKKYRVGILGFGKMGGIRFKALLKDKRVEVISVYESDLTVTLPASLRREKDPDHVIEAPDIDIVLVCTPNKFTCRNVVGALNQGKHVFVEKPPGISLKEVFRMRNAVEESNAKLMFGFNHRHHCSIVKAKEIIDSGVYGDLLWLRGVYGKSLSNEFFANWRSDRSLSGGGILMDQGIHMVDLFLLFLKEFSSINSYVSSFQLKNDIEDNVFALFQTKRGQVASLHSTMMQWPHKFNLDFGLQNGTISINGLKTSSNSYGEESLQANSYWPKVSRPSSKPDFSVVYTIDKSWEREIDIFVDGIINDCPMSKKNISDAITLMKTIEKIYEPSLKDSAIAQR